MLARSARGRRYVAALGRPTDPVFESCSPDARFFGGLSSALCRETGWNARTRMIRSRTDIVLPSGVAVHAYYDCADVLSSKLASISAMIAYMSQQLLHPFW